MMKKYTFKIIVHEGCDEFWESLENKTGCEEVYREIKELLERTGAWHCDGDYQNCELILTDYTNRKDNEYSSS